MWILNGDMYCWTRGQSTPEFHQDRRNVTKIEAILFRARDFWFVCIWYLVVDCVLCL